MAGAVEKAHRYYLKCFGATEWSRIVERPWRASSKDVDARPALFRNFRQSLSDLEEEAGSMILTAHQHTARSAALAS
jgi:hypothetical protein